MAKVDVNKLGITLGVFFGLLHLVWGLVVLVGWWIAQMYLDWIFPLHFLNKVYTVTSFNAVYLLILVIMALVIGYVMGLVLGALWNYIDKKVK